VHKILVNTSEKHVIVGNSTIKDVKMITCRKDIPLLKFTLLIQDLPMQLDLALDVTAFSAKLQSSAEACLVPMTTYMYY